MEGVLHQQCSLHQTNFHAYCCMRSGKTSDRTCLDVQLQRNVQIKRHSGRGRLLHYTMSHIYTNELNFYQRQTQFFLSFYHLLKTNMMKHDGFIKNRNNVFRHCFWYLTMETFFGIGTLNPHTCQVIIFRLKFNHEQIKYFQNLFQDSITIIMYDIFG